jgi:hypothetical protein
MMRVSAKQVDYTRNTATARVPSSCDYTAAVQWCNDQRRTTGGTARDGIDQLKIRHRGARRGR